MRSIRDTHDRRSVAYRGALLLATLVAGSSLSAVAHAAPAHVTSMTMQRQPIGANVNGALVVLATGAAGSGGPPTATLVTAQQGRVRQVLARGLPFPYTGGLAPSPRGRYVAFGEDAAIGPGTSPQTQGLWLVTSAGTGLRRLLLPPRSVEGNQLGIDAVAWSPDRYTLAYAVNPAGGGMNTSRPEPALGIWLTRYDQPRPRLLVTPTQLGAVELGATKAPLFINGLSWSPDGRTLAVSTFRPAPGATQAGQTIPVILAVDTSTGRVRVLVSGAQDGAFAPTGSALAYTTSGGKASTTEVLRVADAQGRHGRALAAGNLASPVWAPDGRTLAYIDGGTTLRTVDLATGRSQAVLTTTMRGQRLLPVGGHFVRLAWLRMPV